MGIQHTGCGSGSGSGLAVLHWLWLWLWLRLWLWWHWLWLWLRLRLRLWHWPPLLGPIGVPLLVGLETPMPGAVSLSFPGSKTGDGLKLAGSPFPSAASMEITSWQDIGCRLES